MESFTNTSPDIDPNLNTSGAGKAYYNSVEINTGGGGTGDRITGAGCPLSAEQPSVICSPLGEPCDVRITVGKGGKLRIVKSE